MEGTLDVSIFAFGSLLFVFASWVLALEGFKDISCEGVLDGFLTALHEGRDLSLGKKTFVESEYLGNGNVGEVLPTCSGHCGSLHCGYVGG